MTSQEAIEELQLTIDLIKQNGKDWLDERDIPILSMAATALEKQIPKKPIEPDALFYKCPICKNCVRDYNRYCTICGNKLDWSGIKGDD